MTEFLVKRVLVTHSYMKVYAKDKKDATLKARIENPELWTDEDVQLDYIETIKPITSSDGKKL